MMVVYFTFGWEMSVSSGLGGDEGGAGLQRLVAYNTVTELCTLCSFMVSSMLTAETKDVMSVSQHGRDFDRDTKYYC